MSTPRSKLGGKQEKAIAALLTAATHEKAAEQAGVSVATLQRWLLLPDFQTAYRVARTRCLESAVGRLQQAAGEAVDALKAGLASEKVGDKLRAAGMILEHAHRGAELLDLAERVAELERLLSEGKGDDEWQPAAPDRLHPQGNGVAPGTEGEPE